MDYAAPRPLVFNLQGETERAVFKKRSFFPALRGTVPSVNKGRTGYGVRTPQQTKTLRKDIRFFKEKQFYLAKKIQKLYFFKGYAYYFILKGILL